MSLWSAILVALMLSLTTADPAVSDQPRPAVPTNSIPDPTALSACPADVERCTQLSYAELMAGVIYAPTPDALPLRTLLAQLAHGQPDGLELGFCVDAKTGKTRNLRVRALPHLRQAERAWLEKLLERMRVWRFRPPEGGRARLYCASVRARTAPHEDTLPPTESGPEFESELQPAPAPLRYSPAQAVYTPLPHRRLLHTVPSVRFRTPRFYTAKVSYCIDERGKTTEIRTRKRSEPMLDKILRDTIRKWRYKPAIVGGRAFKSCMRLRVHVWFGAPGARYGPPWASWMWRWRGYWGW